MTKTFNEVQKIVEDFLRESEVEYKKQFFESTNDQNSYSYELEEGITIFCNEDGYIGFQNNKEEQTE